MKIILRALVVTGLALFSQAGVSQAYPTKPIRMLVGYSAGGGADALARQVAAKMSESLGQQVFVENRPGAGATIAASAAASAPPDGYTLFFADTALLIAPSIYQKLGFDPVKSFAPVSGACTTPLVVVVNPGLKAHNIAELIALLKADPGGKAMARLISGQIQIGIISAPPALAQAKAGRLRPLALTSPIKVAGADWPALADTLPGFDASPRLFVLAPAGTPETVVSQLSSVLKTVLSSKELLEAFAAQGASADWTTPQALGERMAEETRRWTQIAKDAGVKPE